MNNQMYPQTGLLGWLGPLLFLSCYICYYDFFLLYTGFQLDASAATFVFYFLANLRFFCVTKLTMKIPG